MPKLFISYKRGTTAAAPIMEKLEEAGYELWFDRKEIHLGDSNWQAQIDRGLEKCDGVILCISPTACQSKPVRYEVRKALEYGKPIFPIILEKVDSASAAIKDLGLPEKQHLEDFTDVTRWKEQVERLLKDLVKQGLRGTYHDKGNNSLKLFLVGYLRIIIPLLPIFSINSVNFFFSSLSLLANTIILNIIACIILTSLALKKKRSKTGTHLKRYSNPFRNKKGKQEIRWQFSRWRKWFLGSLVVLQLITSVELVTYYIKIIPPDKNIILIANFDGLNQQNNRVTETILEQLRLATENYPDVQVEALNSTITSQEGTDKARLIGNDHKATIVIWGWYGESGNTVGLSVHFEVLRQPQYFPKLSSKSKGEIQTVAISELQSFSLQTKLSARMAYLSLFTMGMIQYSSERWNEAISQFSDALQQTEEDTPDLNKGVVHLYRGYTYLITEKTDQAISDFDKAINLKPDLEEAYIVRGIVFTDKDKYDLAIADFNKAISLAPNDSIALQNRGIAYLESRDYDHALQDFSQIIKHDNKNYAAYVNRGLCYARKDLFDLALSDYNNAIELNPKNGKGFNQRGNIYFYKGDYEKALADYNQTIKLNPDEFYAYYNRGNVYAEKKNFESALKDYNKAVEHNTTNYLMFFMRGRALLSTNQLDRALDDLNKALELKPDFLDTYIARGQLYVQKGLYDNAITDFNQYISPTEQKIKEDVDCSVCQSSVYLSYFGRGKAYYFLQDYKNAIVDLTKALSNMPTTGFVLYTGTNGPPLTYPADGDPTVLDKITIEADEADETYFYRGVSYLKTEAFDKATSDFKKVIELNRRGDLVKQSQDYLKTLG